MKKIVRTLGVAALLVAIARPACAEVMYDWQKSGKYSVGQVTSVRIPEGGEVYLSLSGVKAGGNYTFVAAGSGASVDVVYTYKEDGDTWDDTLSSGVDDVKTANQNRCIVDYDSWLDAWIIIDDPDYKEDKVNPNGYYLCVSGEEGETISISSSASIDPEPIPVGDVDNPKGISPTTVPQTHKANFVESAYYFKMSAKVGTYLLTTSGGDEFLPIKLAIDTEAEGKFMIEEVTDKVASAGNVAYLVKVTSAGTIDFHVFGGDLSFGLTYQYASEGSLGRVTVNTKGTAAKWSIKGASGSYESGETVAILGRQTIAFSKVTGFSTPEDQEATPTEDKPDVEILGVYNDTFDPKDDTVDGATKIAPSAKGITAARTLFVEDEFDHFVFTAKDGVYCNFTLADLVGDAVMTVFRKGDALKMPLAGPDVRIAKLVLDKGDYIVRVAHSNEAAKVDAQYTLKASSANVGAIKFAKTAMSVKKNAGVVKLTVNRSAKEGRVRVRYGTVAGTAKPGERYVAQSGVLEWPDGDSKAKTLEIKLIPDLVAVYDAEQPTTEFKVQLKAMEDDEIEDDEYPAQITVDTCTVTITENAAKTVNSIEKAYAKTVTKAATVKTENVPLRAGTFYGVLTEDGSALTNGLPQLASVTLTTKVSAGKSDTLSAKVALAGKTYTFKTDTKNPAEWENLGDGRMQISLKLVQKVDKVSYTNELTLTVRDGATTDAEGWLGAGGTAELVMNVPDANNKGAQEDIRYVGDIYRQNAKIQNYLNVVTNFFGYYTVALASEGVSASDGIPAGNGYLTVKVDNKGTAKVAGMLADGTKVSVSVTAAGIRKDDSSSFGYAMYLPVFLAKSPYCFGGTLRLYAKPGKTLPNKDYEIVVDSTTALVWNNDNAKLTYYNEDGWRILCDPVGGWYDTVMNLQAYYLNYAFEVGGADITEFPTELVASGYQVITDVQPNGEPVGLVNDAFSTAKKVLVKDGTLYDLVNSVNPCNVQVKLARATGLVTGSFSIWSEDEDGLKQKEITGFKHNGVLLLSRDEFSPISEDVLSVGFSLKTGVKLTDENPDTGKKTTRSWNLSLPFNLLGVDQGDVDWWADDWGWNSEWGEEPID